MSIAIMTRVFGAKDFSSTETLVMLAIGDAANDKGFGYLLIDTITRKTKLSPRTVQGTIAKLCATKPAVLEKRERHNRSSIFRIHADRIEQMPAKVNERELSIEELWGAGDAPLSAGVQEIHPGGANERAAAQSDSPRTVSTPFEEPYPPLPSEGHTPEDLFGEHEISGSTAIALTRGSLIDHVGSGWKALHARYPRIPEIRVMSEARKKAIARRAAEVVQETKGAIDAYQVWDMIFGAIANDPWLRGESNPRQGYDRAYVVEIDHVLRTRGNPNFIQILERSTTNERDRNATSDPSTGRQYGPAEQATRAAIARLRAARESG